jgi:hypothetical protein
VRKKCRGVDLGLRDAGQFGAKRGKFLMNHGADVFLKLGDTLAGNAVHHNRAHFDGFAFRARDTIIERTGSLEIYKNIVAVEFPVFAGQNSFLFSRAHSVSLCPTMSIRFKIIGVLMLVGLTLPGVAQTSPESQPTLPETAKPNKPAADLSDKTEKVEIKKPLSPEETEAEQKRLKELAERDLAAKKAAEEAALRKAEEEKTFIAKLLENSKLYTGITGGLGLGLNKIHGAGLNMGMSIDYLAYKSYGFHFATQTGQYPAKASTMASGTNTVAIPGEGSFGFLSFDFAAVYALPAFLNLEPAVGLGVAIYQLRGGTADFNQGLAPLFYGSLYYNLLSHLQIGFIAQLTLASASKLQSAGTEYALDSSTALTTASLQLSLRYSWF